MWLGFANVSGLSSIQWRAIPVANGLQCSPSLLTLHVTHAQVFNPASYYNGQGTPPVDSYGGTAVGTVNAVLTWSTDARNWHYIKPVTSFIPRGSSAAGDFDCCGVFVAKQDPTLTPAFLSGSVRCLHHY